MDDDSNKVKVKIQVIDKGIGINEED